MYLSLCHLCDKVLILHCLLRNSNFSSAIFSICFHNFWTVPQNNIHFPQCNLHNPEMQYSSLYPVYDNNSVLPRISDCYNKKFAPKQSWHCFTIGTRPRLDPKPEVSNPVRSPEICTFFCFSLSPHVHFQTTSYGIPFLFPIYWAPHVCNCFCQRRKLPETRFLVSWMPYLLFLDGDFQFIKRPLTIIPASWWLTYSTRNRLFPVRIPVRAQITSTARHFQQGWNSFTMLPWFSLTNWTLTLLDESLWKSKRNSHYWTHITLSECFPSPVKPTHCVSGHYSVWLFFIPYSGTNTISQICQSVHEGGIFSLCVTQDGHLISGGGKDKRIVFFDAALNPIGDTKELPELHGSVRTIAQGPGEMLLIGTTKNTILQVCASIVFLTFSVY